MGEGRKGKEKKDMWIRCFDEWLVEKEMTRIQDEGT